MPTVRDAAFDLFRAQGMTTMFGNPGSTELPMLAEFPSDFRYVLGLQEAVAVGMADGYAQASGRTALVNLHTAPGVGNAMGAIFNAQANHSPLLITAGQQVRAQITMQANLTNRDATRMPHPLVKWSYEPPRAEDVPLALAHGAHLASLPPKGPVFVSLPMDDWYAEVDEADARQAVERTVTGRATADPGGGALPRRAPRRGEQPGARRRPRHRRRAAAGTRRSAWPSASGCRSGRRRRRAVAGSASPRAIPTSAACCRRRSARSPRPWRATTWSSSPAARSSPTTPTSPARCCRRGRSWWRSPATPTRPRAPRWATRSSPT